MTGSLRPVLQKYISFDAMTRRAVGPGWRQFTEDQQKKATQLFTTLIIRTYSSKLTPGEQPVIKFKTASARAPGRVEVPTTLLYQGSQYNVTYRMEEAEGWRITDVMVEGVSLIANYRTQFDAQFKKGGSNAVISALISIRGPPAMKRHTSLLSLLLVVSSVALLTSCASSSRKQPNHSSSAAVRRQ